jgi:hypothetical protein
MGDGVSTSGGSTASDSGGGSRAAAAAAKFKSALLNAALVMGVLTCLALLSRASERRGGTALTPKASRDVSRILKEAARWSAVSDQDSNALLQLVHATYAVAYVNAARALAQDEELERAAKLKVDELHAQVTGQQQAVIQKLGAKYSGLLPEGANVLYTGWI